MKMMALPFQVDGGMAPGSNALVEVQLVGPNPPVVFRPERLVIRLTCGPVLR